MLQTHRSHLRLWQQWILFRNNSCKSATSKYFRFAKFCMFFETAFKSLNFPLHENNTLMSSMQTMPWNHENNPLLNSVITFFMKLSNSKKQICLQYSNPHPTPNSPILLLGSPGKAGIFYCGIIYFRGAQFSWIHENGYIRGEVISWIGWLV